MLVPAFAKVIYVDDNATADGDGASWVTAHKYLQDALAVAEYGDEIWVAEGTYKPDQGAGKTAGDRASPFVLVNGVGMYGGFLGTETTRNPQGDNNQTILSGEIDENSTLWSLNVVSGVDLDANTTLDGFRITKGNANGARVTVYQDGGGLWIKDSEFQISNCVFTNNSAGRDGGGIYCSSPSSTSSPSLTNCVFTNNSAGRNGGGISSSSPSYSSNSLSLTNCVFTNNSADSGGGGIHSTKPITLTNCVFTNNSAHWGGGIYSSSSRSTSSYFTNCVFTNNSAGLDGGGMRSSYFLTLTNCVFTNNSAGRNGGGISSSTNSYSSNSLTLTNCVFTSNSAGLDGGGGIYSETDHPFSLILTNCILWANTSNSIEGHGLNANLEDLFKSFALQQAIEAEYPGDPNARDAVYEPNLNILQGWDGDARAFDADPLFADIDNPIGPDGIWFTDDDGLRLRKDSSAIDAGYNDALGNDAGDLDGDGNVNEQIPLDMAGFRRIQGGTIDFGPYEYGSQAPTKTIHVDDNATADGDGVSWSTAYKYLQDALTAAEYGDEIWVAEGTYKPDQGAGKTAGDRASPFVLVNGVGMYGGFIGTETTRNPQGDNNQTILSGEISEDSELWSLNVVSGVNLDANTTLDGFRITKGNANGASGTIYENGGGVYLKDSNLTFSNLNITNNSAGSNGGGIYSDYYSSLSLNKCIFSNNTAGVYGGGFCSNRFLTLNNCVFTNNSASRGGGIYSYSLTLNNCLFTNNSCRDMGGGIYSIDSSTLTNCVFTNNSTDYSAAGRAGGAIYSSDSLILTNCVFTKNFAGSNGGGIYSNYRSLLTLNNCVFTNNSASKGGGIYSDSWHYLTLSNCILWKNSTNDVIGHGLKIISWTSITIQEAIEAEYPGDPSARDAVYEPNLNILQGWEGDARAFDADPLFVDIDNPAGPDGIWFTEDDGLRLIAGSPAIDAGYNNSLPTDSSDLDMDGNTTEPIPFDALGRNRFVGVKVDIGAYEHSASIFNSRDEDGDGLSNFDEINTYFTSVANSDSDGDGINDYSEIENGSDPNRFCSLQVITNDDQGSVNASWKGNSKVEFSNEEKIFPKITDVNLTASSKENYIFSHWEISGKMPVNSNPLTLKIDDRLSIKPIFSDLNDHEKFNDVNENFDFIWSTSGTREGWTFENSQFESGSIEWIDNLVLNDVNSVLSTFIPIPGDLSFEIKTNKMPGGKGSVFFYGSTVYADNPNFKFSIDDQVFDLSDSPDWKEYTFEINKPSIVSWDAATQVAVTSGSSAYVRNFTFVPKGEPTVTLESSVNPNGAGSIAGLERSYYFPYEILEVEAKAVPPFIFKNWSGDFNGTENPLRVTLDSNKSIIANFVKTYSIDYSVEPEVSGAIEAKVIGLDDYTSVSEEPNYPPSASFFDLDARSITNLVRHTIPKSGYYEVVLNALPNAKFDVPSYWSPPKQWMSGFVYSIDTGPSIDHRFGPYPSKEEAFSSFQNLVLFLEEGQIITFVDPDNSKGDNSGGTSLVIYPIEVRGTFFEHTKGLVAYFPFDGNALDMSGNGNHGTVYGATSSTDRNGNANKAYAFDGVDDWIGLNQAINDSAFTVSVWAKFSGNSEGVIFSNYNGGPPRKGGLIRFQGNQDFRFSQSNILQDDSKHLRFSSSEYQPENWSNYLFTYGNNVSKLFINGEQRGLLKGLDPSSETHITLGKSSWANDRFLKGMIDEIRIYNRELSNDEIWELHEYEKINDGDHSSEQTGKLILREGSTVSMLASSYFGYEFKEWSGDVNGSENPLIISDVKVDMDVYANFIPKPYKINVLESSDGIVNGGGFIQEGKSTTLVAIPNNGFLFDHWSGDISGTENPLSISSVTENMTIKAEFKKDYFQSEDVENLAGGWKNLSWFGIYYPALNGWLYHEELGWVYAFTSNSQFWMYNDGFGWLWTSETIWPFLWHHDTKSWNYYDGDKSFPYYNYEVSTWIKSTFLTADVQRVKAYSNSNIKHDVLEYSSSALKTGVLNYRIKMFYTDILPAIPGYTEQPTYTMVTDSRFFGTRYNWIKTD